MSTIHLIWIASGLGALLFFFSGYLLSRLRSQAAVDDLTSVSGQELEQEVAPYREQVRRSKAREAELGRELEGQRGKAESLQMEVQDLGRRLAAQTQEARDLSEKLKSARSLLEATGHKTLPQFGGGRQEGGAQDELRDALKEAQTGKQQAEARSAELQQQLDQTSRKTQELQEHSAGLEAELELLRRLSGAMPGGAGRVTIPQWRPGLDTAALKAELQQSQTQVDQLYAELETARRRFEEAEGFGAALRQQVAQLEQDLRAAEQIASSARTLRPGELRPPTGQTLLELMHQNEELSCSLRTADQRLQRLDELEQERRLLEIRVRELEGVITSDGALPPDDPTRTREGDLQRRALTAEVEHLRRQVEMLQSENFELRNISGRKDRSDRLRQRSTRPLPLTGDSIQGLMEAVTRREGTLGAVLSDHNGLTVVKSGHNTEEMAAVAAHLVKVSDQHLCLLPLGSLDRLSLSDGKERAVTIFPIGLDRENPLLLALLSEGVMPDRASLSELIHQAATLLG